MFVAICECAPVVQRYRYARANPADKNTLGLNNLNIEYCISSSRYTIGQVVRITHKSERLYHPSCCSFQMCGTAKIS